MELTRSYARPIRVGTVLGIVGRRQTYSNVLYLLASFPLGLAYFVFLVTAVSLGGSLLVVLVGAPMLLLLPLVWWRLGEFERELAMWWLGVEIASMPRPEVDGLVWWRRVVAYLTTQLTWTTLLYLLLKFPLGVLGLALATGSAWLTAWLLAAPVGALLGTGPVPGVVAVVSPLFPLLAVVVAVLSLHLLNALAVASGHFARLMLGTGDIERRLVETEALAERQQIKAERAEQSRRELIVNVSHELRTPAASIRGHVESLLLASEKAETGAPAPPELRQYLGIVHRETERLGTLVDELLSLARAEAGELRLEIAPVAAGEVVEEVYQTLAPLARRERQVTLVQEVAEGLPPVLADKQRLRQVLLNLVRNAIQYTPEGGIVSIQVERSGPAHVALCVADTGVGIAPEELERVWERFYRADESRTRASGGFGLGLAIVRDLVQAMGGAVTAESTPGEGSRFRVVLPAGRADGG